MLKNDALVVFNDSTSIKFLRSEDDSEYGRYKPHFQVMIYFRQAKIVTFFKTIHS